MLLACNGSVGPPGVSGSVLEEFVKSLSSKGRVPCSLYLAALYVCSRSHQSELQSIQERLIPLNVAVVMG
jgi:hypothetical protein